MPKRIQPLSDIQVKNAKPAPKETKLFDGGGLYLLITPSGGKLWQLKYRYDGKEKNFPSVHTLPYHLLMHDSDERMPANCLPMALIQAR